MISTALLVSAAIEADHGGHRVRAPGRRAERAARVPLNVGVILGQDNRTADTSDQEQWAVQQAASDVSAMLAATASRFSLQLSTVFTGEDKGSPAALAAVQNFLQTSSESGAGIIVGAYLSESALLAIRSSLDSLGLTLLAPASGLPTLPAPREQILRLWPNDKQQARAFTSALLANATAVALLSRDDVSGRAFASMLASELSGRSLLLPGGGPFYYNASEGVRSFAPHLAQIERAIAASAAPAISFVCDCGSDEIAAILDAMSGHGWPNTTKTRFYLTDRATPTRAVVATPQRRAFAAALRTTGVLSHLPTANNPTYAALAARWRAAGQRSSLFASALSSYDAVRIAALASIVVGGANTTRAAGLRAAAVSVADQAWGASGMMALDEHGDLYRAVYDVYTVTEAAGWQVVGPPIDARGL